MVHNSSGISAPPDAPLTFGRLIREARLARWEKQPSVAQRASISREHLSHLENDHAEPGLFLALRLLRALGIEAESLGDIVIRRSA